MQPHREPPSPSSDESGKTGRKRTLAKGLTLVAGMAILAGLGIVLHSMWSVEPALGSNESPAEAVKRIPVVLTAAREMTFESTVAVSGSVQAKDCPTGVDSTATNGKAWVEPSRLYSILSGYCPPSGFSNSSPAAAVRSNAGS